VPEAKKARYDLSQQQNQSNKVVSLRNIPADITDLQIALIGLQFGEVVNILYIKGKGQVKLEEELRCCCCWRKFKINVKFTKTN
jgi:hypothetical protein